MEISMSDKYNATVAALSTNEELRNKVMASSSAEERAGHLRAAGLEVPTHDEINSRHSDLADVAGAGNPPQTKTIITTAAPAAVPAAVAGAAG